MKRLQMFAAIRNPPRDRGLRSPSRRTGPRGPGAAVVLSVMLSLAPLSGCDDPTETALADDALTEIDADIVMYGMTQFLTRKGVRSGEVRADSAYAFRDSAVVRLYEVDMTVFTEAGRERAAVVADSGKLHERSEKMVAWGDVVVTFPGEDRRIETTELHYEPSAERIWSDSATTYRAQGRETRGTCFLSDLQFRNWSVCNVRGAAEIRGPATADTAGGTRR